MSLSVEGSLVGFVRSGGGSEFEGKDGGRAGGRDGGKWAEAFVEMGGEEKKEEEE